MPPAYSEEVALTVNIKRLTLDAANKMAFAAITKCRQEGVQVAVTIVDRGGHPQVIMRDTLAPDFALTVSQQKAYTAMTFNTSLSRMLDRFNSPSSLGKIDGVVFSAGGLPINAAGHILGGIGVSGAPTGELDERCAQAGVNAIQDDLEMAD